MRHVNRSYKKKPPRLITLETHKHLMSIVRDTSICPRSDIYRDPYKTGRTDDGTCSRVIDQLNKSYFNKCAYCEQHGKLDVEHYRPKGSIDDLTHPAIKPGYFWLCYEWSNLLPACVGCNREGGKYDKFPYLPGGGFVGGTPIKRGKFDPQACHILALNLRGEKPVLLHPEVDRDFLHYFAFAYCDKFTGIFIKGIDADGRGEKTIEICNLNRESLRIERLRIIDEFIITIETIFSAYAKKVIDATAFKNSFKMVLSGLKGLARDKQASHTLLRRYIIQDKSNFQQIILPRIRQSRLGRVLKEATDSYWEKMFE